LAFSWLIYDTLKKYIVTSVRDFIIFSFLFLIGISSFAAAPQPNILFVFIDDIGWGDLSCYGSTVTNKLGEPITPNLDRLASQGIRFTQGYVASPICSPSRTGMITGIEPARYAIYSFIDNKTANASRNMADWLQPDTVTSPRLFQQAGYKTGQFGKWHMGNGRDVNNAPPPTQYGFDQSLVAFEGNGDRLLYWNDNGTKYGLSQQNEDATVGSFEYCYFYEAAGKQVDAALTFITNAVTAGKPFYVHVPFNDTHSPYNVPPGQENDFDHITSDTASKTFLGELHNLDKQIGRLVQAVDGLGIATNTLIVVIGDNGAPNDSLNQILNRNGGLRGGKGNLYEGGFREPFMVRWPGTIPAGVVNSNTAISTLDLLPTYCSFAQIPLPNAPFAGENMSDVFRGSTRMRNRPLFWEYGTVSALSPASPKLAVRDGNYKFMRNPDGTRRELYLIPQDHAEANNLVNQAGYSGVVSNLEAQLMTWYDEHVLGNLGETYDCTGSNFSGLALSDNYNVTGDNSPGSGFGANSGVNYEIATRLTGGAASGLVGYRLGGTGGTSPRQASDFGIVSNRLSVAARNGNGRFEFSADGFSAFDFGNFLAGHSYELSVQMNITGLGPNSQRMSLSLADGSNLAVQNVDLGVQIGPDGAGGIGVYKRVDAGSNSGGSDVNSRMVNGLPVATPVAFTIRVTDFNQNVTDYNSSYEILVNGASVSSGFFRFNDSATDRFLIFDVAAHDSPVNYDDFSLTVTGGSSAATCRKPILSLSDVRETDGLKARLFWTAQAGLAVAPEYSVNLSQWFSITNSAGNPLNVTTPHGSIQWLEVPAPLTNQSFFIRLNLK
jgi:arylsulfatase A-like enzyme